MDIYTKLDEGIASYLIMTKFHFLAPDMDSEQEKEEFIKKGLLALTEEERKIFSRVTLDEIVGKIKAKYGNIDGFPIADIYPEGIIVFYDKDSKGYSVAMEHLGYKLIDGVFQQE